MNPFSLVFVCSGNRFRSALAEAFMRRLTLGLPVTVESYGTLELGAAPALPEAVDIALWCGLDLSSHRARHVGMRPLDRADLVVGFERDHVRAAVVEAAAKRERSFTFRELVRLLEDVPEPKLGSVVLRARALVAAAAERRGSLAPSGSDSIADPFGRSWRVYRETAEETRQLCSRLAERLFAVHRGDFQPLPAKLPRRRIGWRR